MKKLHQSGSMPVEPISADRKQSLKSALAVNLKQILKRRSLTITKLTALLKNKGSDINSFAVRAWLRTSERRPTLPSALNLVILSEVLGVTIEELFNMEPLESASFFRKLREPEDHLEREIVRVVSAIQKEYDSSLGDPEFIQQSLTTGNEYTKDDGSPENDAARLDRRAYYYLLANDLVRFFPEAIARDITLEKRLVGLWEKKGNGSVLDQVCI